MAGTDTQTSRHFFRDTHQTETDEDRQTDGLKGEFALFVWCK